MRTGTSIRKAVVLKACYFVCINKDKFKINHVLILVIFGMVNDAFQLFIFYDIK
jgi:hypothetical protein